LYQLTVNPSCVPLLKFLAELRPPGDACAYIADVLVNASTAMTAAMVFSSLN
jgi:hypothetical protein